MILPSSERVLPFIKGNLVADLGSISATMGPLKPTAAIWPEPR